MNMRCLVLLAGMMIVPSLPVFAQSYSTPVAYCRAVGTIDKPDSRYTGPKLPRWMGRQLNLSATQADQMEWRCAHGAILACVYGANIPCNAKADTNSQPSPAVNDYCRQNPDTSFIPAVVTGHESNISWACRGGQPYVTGSAELDAQGYVKSYWKPVKP
ncbi:MAG: hypothetical protein JST79_16095 [Acidobacteria bacterium]|jgi:hypothetical protein|nr:hypothetical protein [Acidobacteriota bacterium]